jgi:hypothetical protein
MYAGSGNPSLAGQIVYSPSYGNLGSGGYLPGTITNPPGGKAPAGATPTSTPIGQVYFNPNASTANTTYPDAAGNVYQLQMDTATPTATTNYYFVEYAGSVTLPGVFPTNATGNRYYTTTANPISVNDNAGNPVTGYTMTGGNTQIFVYETPGAGVESVSNTVTQLNSPVTGQAYTVPDNPYSASLLISGTHTGGQVQGGVANNLPDQTQSLLSFITSVKSQATTYVDLTNGSTNMTGSNSAWGNPDTSPTQPAIVYASGSYINGVWQESFLKFGGNFRGCGLLVFECDDPSQAHIEFDGSSEWVGEVIVYAHKAPPAGSTNSAPFITVGGGTQIHIIGGALLLFDPNSGIINNSTVVKLAGNSAINYSPMNLAAAFKAYPKSMAVRSWRKIRP